MEHHFNVATATRFGTDKAILLQNIAFWIKKNVANEVHYYDGHYWTYNSGRAFARLFPYWNEKKISRMLLSLEEEGIIKSGNYNSNKYDRTKWYTIIDKQINDIYEIHWTKVSNRTEASEQPIPYRKPDRKPDNNSYAIAEATQQNILCFREELEKRLFHDIEKTCLSCLADRSQYDYPRERKFIKVLVGKTKEKENPSDFMKSFFMTFGRLKRDGGKFWSSQPWLPSTLASGGIYPRIVEEMKREPEYIETGAKVTFV